jgi:hypothetical protein
LDALPLKLADTKQALSRIGSKNMICMASLEPSEHDLDEERSEREVRAKSLRP